MALKSKQKKRSRELLHFLDFYKNNEKIYEIKPKKNQTGRRGGGSRDRRWIEKIICFCCTSLWVHWTYSFNIQAILLQRIYFMPRVYPMIMFQNRVVKSANLAIFESSLFRSLLCNFRMHIFHDARQESGNRIQALNCCYISIFILI